MPLTRLTHYEFRALLWASTQRCLGLCSSLARLHVRASIPGANVRESLYAMTGELEDLLAELSSAYSGYPLEAEVLTPGLPSLEQSSAQSLFDRWVSTLTSIGTWGAIGGDIPVAGPRVSSLPARVLGALTAAHDRASGPRPVPQMFDGVAQEFGLKPYRPPLTRIPEAEFVAAFPTAVTAFRKWADQNRDWAPEVLAAALTEATGMSPPIALAVCQPLDSEVPS